MIKSMTAIHTKTGEVCEAKPDRHGFFWLADGTRERHTRRVNGIFVRTLDEAYVLLGKGLLLRMGPSGNMRCLAAIEVSY